MTIKRRLLSYQIYFSIVALVLGLIVSRTLPQITGNYIALFFIMIQSCMAILYLYIGIKFKKLIMDKPKMIYIMLLVNVCLIFASFITNLVFSSGSSSDLMGIFVRSLFGLGLNWYFYKDIKKLEQEYKNQVSV